MKQAGFTHIGTQDGTAILQRDFAGFKSCTVDVSTLKAVNVVSTIGVIFPACEDRCTWYTTFETKNGDIQLSLQKGEYGQCFVLLEYYDKINTDTVRSAAMNEL